MHYYEKPTPKLLMWSEEAHRERYQTAGGNKDCMDYALYPRRFYKAVAQFEHSKKYDFCFIGAFKVDDETQKNRAWIIPFISEHFTASSYLQFTDKATRQNYTSLGSFDHTLSVDGFVPKEHAVEDRNKFDGNYFARMCQSAFTLCPAGDKFYSMRFYEALMCRSIPIVQRVDETFRSQAESLLDYRYYMTADEFEYREDWAEHNYQLFLQHHTLENTL